LTNYAVAMIVPAVLMAEISYQRERKVTKVCYHFEGVALKCLPLVHVKDF